MPLYNLLSVRDASYGSGGYDNPCPSSNTQGEEATVVILSLVRSRPDGNIGFLRMKNRINVLLSRAKHGMYMFGNADTLRKASEPPPEGSRRPPAPMWGQVLDMLEERNSIGTAFEVNQFELYIWMHGTYAF